MKPSQKTQKIVDSIDILSLILMIGGYWLRQVSGWPGWLYVQIIGAILVVFDIVFHFLHWRTYRGLNIAFLCALAFMAFILLCIWLKAE